MIAESQRREFRRDHKLSLGSALAGAAAQGPGCIESLSQVGVGFRSASETRVLAIALQRAPILGLMEGTIAGRWRVGPEGSLNFVGSCPKDGE